MITARIQIANDAITDTFKRYGLIYLSSDNRMEAPIKKRDTTSYAEEAGEHIDPRTVQDVFDYKVNFLIECPNKDLDNANAKIATFNKALYVQAKDSDIRTYKEITFYDDYKRVKIVGLAEPIAEPAKLYRRQNGRVMDCAQVELIIHVSDPTKCDFNMTLADD